jgi:glycerophosphoryl diester phosphodiesterase
MTILVLAMGAILILWGVANLVIGLFSASAFALLTVRLYDRLGRSQDARFAWSEISEPRPTRAGWIFSTKALLAGLIVGGIAAAIVGGLFVDSIQLEDDVLVMAHRGASSAAPENTLAAVERAIADGADFVEIDVQETADGEVVVIHDSDFMKLAGVDLKVSNGTLQQMREIDIGSWFSPEFSAERVPTLTEVLVDSRGQSRVVIELKYYDHDQQLERRVVDIIEQADMVNDVAIMSLKYDGLQKIRRLRPEWVVGLLSAKAIGNPASLDVDFLAVNMGMVTPRFIRRARLAGKQVFVWTVNDPVSMSRMMSLGVNGIITDEPEMAVNVLADRSGLSSVERLLVHTAVLFGRPVPPRIYRDESP